MKTRYRIVRDQWLGFEAQYRPWWWPFWMQCGFSNTSSTLEHAKKVIEKHKRNPLYEE